MKVIVALVSIVFHAIKEWVCGKMGHKLLTYRDVTICTRCHSEHL